MKRLILAALVFFPLAATPVPAQIARHVVISEIYGGGGNAGAVYRNDFVELYNPTPTGIQLSGWSVQYASATGTGTWHAAPLGGTILPYSYYLIQLSGGTNGIALPPADTTGSINMAATAGKVALVRTTALLSGSNPADSTIVDLVGYGTADGYEGAGPAPAPGAAASIERKATPQSTAASMAPGGADAGSGNGWDANNNAADFVSQPTLNPQNSGAPAERPPDDLLPIRFGTIAAEAKAGAGVQVSWTTLSETACYGFEVERSASPAGGFLVISALIAGHGTTIVTHYYSFVDPDGTLGKYYRVKEIDTNGAEWLSETVQASAVSSVRAAESGVNADFGIYPNPFNPSTTITFSLAAQGTVTIAIYDVLGRRVTTLASGRYQAGTHEVRWEAAGVPSGVYLCRLEGSASAPARRLLLIR